jgi:peptide/nickel transport system permease protein
MRGAMINALTQDYVRTARAKGLDEKSVLWKHSFKNSLLPIITLFASVFPLAISGSIVLEIIFSIPGMGKLAFDALDARNYPVVYSVVMFSAILTLFGYLVADILYALVDPRISYDKK